MTDADPPIEKLHEPEGPPTAAGRPPRRWRPRRPRTPIGWIIAAVASLVLLGGLLVVGGRYGVLLPQARLMIEARTDGLKIGRFGRLKLEGIEGDIWTNFTVRRLTVSDEGGVWLDARRLTVRWRYVQLLRRKLDIDSLTAQQVQVLRRPTLAPKGVDKGMPVTVQIDRAQARIDMLPAFSGRRGVYDLGLRNLSVVRGGGTRLNVNAYSVLHPGDFLKARIDLGRKKELLVVADALEARGGAIAGAIGLDPNQPFSLFARLTGTVGEGRLALLARSGATIPASAQGAWGPGGGALTAKVDLLASRLTGFWGRRLGQYAQFSVIGKRRPDKLYDFEIRGVAPNLNLLAKGPVDAAKRRALGLQTKVTFADINPFFSIPEMGRTDVTGVITGTLNDLKLSKGFLVINDLKDATWRLPRADGPGSATFKNRQLDFEGTLTGRGGYGPPDWHTIILGPSPKVNVTGTMFKDGRLLIRSIDASGKNMRATGDGTRSIFGQLNFKGKLELLSLKNETPGSSGTAQMTWLATQKDERSPWDVTLDGAAQNFALGQRDLDRLIGRTPKFRLTGSYFKQVFTIAKLTGSGGQAQVEGAGVRAPNGQLTIKGTWSAKGPFAVGPVELVGDMRGTGTVTGTIEEPKADLLANFDELALPALTIRPGQMALTFLKGANKITAGGIGITGATPYGPARFKSGFRFRPDGVDYTGIDADLGGVKATGALSLRETSPSSADLVVAVGPGALLTEGAAGGTVRIVDGPGGPTASIRLQTGGATLRAMAVTLDSARFTADGPLARLPYTVQAKGAWNRTPLVLDGSGQIAEAKGLWNVNFSGEGQARAAKFRTVQPVLLRFGGPETSAQLRLALGGGLANIDARGVGDAVNIKAALQGVDIGFLSEDFAGRFDADLTLQGRGSQLNGSLNARLDDARSRDAGARLGLDGQVKAVLTDNRLSVDAGITSNQGLKSSASFVFSTEASAKPFRIAIARNQPMQGRFEADGEIQPLWDLFLGGERTLGGQVATNVTVGGTFNDPRISGVATMSRGKFEDYATGLSLSNLTVAADLRSDQILVRQFSAVDGKNGSVSGSGKASLNRGGASDFTLNLKRFRLIDNDIATADASGDVTVTRGSDGRIKIAGALSIDQAEINAAAQLETDVPSIDVIEINRPPSIQRQLPPPARKGIGAALDVRLTAPRRVFVRGRGLDVEMAVTARVTGTTSVPDLEGTARIVRGEYEFAGKRFLFDERGLVQLSTNPAQVRLDLRAIREDPSLTAVVQVRGTAAKPEISLTSTPVLPNDEVLSQVLFGRSASQLSPLEAAQLASALTALATGGGFDVIGGLRGLAGLDRLALAGGGETALSVAGGKYLTDNVYLEIAGGGRDGPSAEVDFRVNRRLSIISRLTSQAGAKLAVRWRRDFGDRRSDRPNRRR